MPTYTVARSTSRDTRAKVCFRSRWLSNSFQAVLARATFSAEPTAVAPHLARTFEKVISTMMNRLSEPNDRIVDEVGAVPLAFAHSPEYPVSTRRTRHTVAVL